MSQRQSPDIARVHDLVLPHWEPLSSQAAAPLLIATAEAHLEGRDRSPDELLSGAQAALGRLTYQGLHQARSAAAKWWRDAGRSLLQVPHPSLEMAAPWGASPELPADAVLYHNGLPYTVLVEGDTETEAKARLLDTERNHPVWMLFTPFVVAATPTGAWVREPASPVDAWTELADHELRWLLEPSNLSRVIDEGLRTVLAASDGPLAQLSTEALEAIGWAVHRAGERADGLLSVTEGANPEAVFVRLCIELATEHRRVIAAVDKREVRERLQAALEDQPRIRKDPMGITGEVCIEPLHELATEFDRRGPQLDPRVVVAAFGVDEGFGSERGFKLRQLYPMAPWVSMTSLPPEAVPFAVRHAFGNPQDDEGILTTVQDQRGCVPVEEVRVGPFPPPDEALLPIAESFVYDYSHLGAGSGHTLVLVQDAHTAAMLAQRLQEGDPSHAESIINATQYGKAWEGWARLEDAEQPAIVIRASLPFWSARQAITIDQAIVCRRIGKTTTARLRRILGRPRPGKTTARLIAPRGEFLPPLPAATSPVNAE